jgi:tellurite resistance protein
VSPYIASAAKIARIKAEHVVAADILHVLVAVGLDGTLERREGEVAAVVTVVIML